MINRTFIYMLILLLAPSIMNAQAKFIQSGKLEFERKINVHRQGDAVNEGEWLKDILSKQPAFNTSTFTLSFDSTATIYKPGMVETIPMTWLIGPAKENTVYTNFEKKLSRSNKTVYEQQFIVTDSLNSMNWKISDEKRTIAGFECRKAVGRICDSVYVVAFYTEEIMVSGGPESFSGLPGMILGLVVPRLHTTWFATRLLLSSPAKQDFETGKKGLATDREKLEKKLNASLKDWGAMGQRNIWWSML